MAVVEVRFSPLPEHVRTARLVATAIARRAGVGDDFLDEVRFAVGEACARAVDLHRRYVPDAPVTLHVVDAPGRLEVTIVDSAPGGQDVDDSPEPLGSGVFDPDAIVTAVPRQPDGDVERDPAFDFLPAGFGLAVIQGLVDDVDVTFGDDGAGTSVKMVWATPAGPSQSSPAPPIS